MTKHTESWNTGRLYTKAGQIIIASWDDEDGEVTFNDISRMIDGQLRTAYASPPRSLQSVVMNAYDHNLYDGNRRSWQDAQGCNARPEAQS
jgi:hypothetical protein